MRHARIDMLPHQGRDGDGALSTAPPKAEWADVEAVTFRWGLDTTTRSLALQLIEKETGRRLTLVFQQPHDLAAMLTAAGTMADRVWPGVFSVIKTQRGEA